jgi:hypothetical protein
MSAPDWLLDVLVDLHGVKHLLVVLHHEPVELNPFSPMALQ